MNVFESQSGYDLVHRLNRRLQEDSEREEQLFGTVESMLITSKNIAKTLESINQTLDEIERRKQEKPVPEGVKEGVRFEVTVRDGDVFINDHIAGQLAWTPEAVGSIIARWLEELEVDDDAE